MIVSQGREWNAGSVPQVAHCPRGADGWAAGAMIE